MIIHAIYELGTYTWGQQGTTLFASAVVPKLWSVNATSLKNLQINAGSFWRPKKLWIQGVPTMIDQPYGVQATMGTLYGSYVTFKFGTPLSGQAIIPEMAYTTYSDPASLFMDQNFSIDMKDFPVFRPQQYAPTENFWPELDFCVQSSGELLTAPISSTIVGIFEIELSSAAVVYGP